MSLTVSQSDPGDRPLKEQIITQQSYVNNIDKMKNEDKRCYIAHRVHKAVLATHSEYFRAKVLRWTCADEPERPPALKCRDESLKLIEGEACSELDVGGELSGRVALFNPQPRAGSHNDCTLAEAFDARGEYEAALAVLHFMYNGDLPDEMKWPVNLAQTFLSFYYLST
ncbi:hypothetical protein HaLaN_13889 [Haematococcus lacustris]|uniref:BTB domain-containing protein n=1 Tax=Haematococcus lacustris TaxID=44745 RepID=A0A699ZDM6_HAELA|nr:hypothetical protein HaLaN_13889 [Haematococcus lacustris]